MSFLDPQMVEKQHNVFDHLKAVGSRLLRLVRTPVPPQIEEDDQMIPGDHIDHPGQLPIDDGAGV